jgi:hypothetical protein
MICNVIGADGFRANITDQRSISFGARPRCSDIAIEVGGFVRERIGGHRRQESDASGNLVWEAMYAVATSVAETPFRESASGSRK